MRADRLISILLLLQSRDRMTAHELARELEVSERTIYRDIEALSTSGVPFFAQCGPGGGLALLGRYRTNLTGMNEDELRALFMAFGPASPLELLGAGQSLRSAVRKLSASLSTGQRDEEDKVRQRFLLDGSSWSKSQAGSPHLNLLQRAVWDDLTLRLRYHSFLGQPIEVVVAPYALVAKTGTWFLVAQIGGTLRVYPVRKLLHIEVLSQHFERQPDFDLGSFWSNWCAAVEKNQQAFEVRLRVSPALSATLFNPASPGAADERGWMVQTLAFESFEAARDRILGFGAAAEVIEPEALRRSVMDYAAQIMQLYTK